MDTVIASEISTKQRGSFNRSCVIEIRTAKLARRQRCGRVRKCSIVRELENALDLGVDVSRRLVWGGGDETAGRTGEGASGQEAFVELV